MTKQAEMPRALSERKREPLSVRRMLAHDSEAIIDSAREVRKLLVRVVDMCSKRKQEVLYATEDGSEKYDMQPLSDQERKSQFYKAMTWLNAAEDELRRDCRRRLRQKAAAAAQGE